MAPELLYWVSSPEEVATPASVFFAAANLGFGRGIHVGWGHFMSIQTGEFFLDGLLDYLQPRIDPWFEGPIFTDTEEYAWVTYGNGPISGEQYLIEIRNMLDLLRVEYPRALPGNWGLPRTYKEDVPHYQDLDRLPMAALIAHVNAYWKALPDATLQTDHSYTWVLDVRAKLAQSYWRPLYVTISPFAYAPDGKVTVVPDEKMRLTMQRLRPYGPEYILFWTNLIGWGHRVIPSPLANWQVENVIINALGVVAEEIATWPAPGGP